MRRREEPPPPQIRPYPGVRSYTEPRAPIRRNTAWELVVCGDLTDQQSELLGKLAEVAPGSRGIIYFDSNGGSAYTGLALASIIRLRGLDAVAVAAGECSSAAIMPFAACKERYVTRHSSLLFHPIRWQSDEHVRLEEAVEWARHFRELEADHDELLSRLFECDRKLIDDWNRPGRFVSGSELVEAGLARLLDLFDGDVWSQISRIKSEPAPAIEQ